MSAKILIFDKSRESGEALAQSITISYGNLFGSPVFSFHDPEDVFTKALPDTAIAAFFMLSTFYDAEAARKFNAFHEDVPLVLVSDSGEYGALSWRLGTCYYLTRPIAGDKLRRALRKCADNRWITVTPC